jgi:hypothetical protein
MATSNGKNGGLLKGKRHYDKNGKPLGGIKAIVTDTGQAVELEGGEVIINREASKKYWKELSKINQSAGGGVPILPPDSVEANTDEYKLGGRTIEFNPNHLPNKWVYEYAKNIKEKYPKVWDLGGNQFGNEAYKNLERALKRGYWTDNEEWMYVKWQSFNARHKGDFLIAGVIANLKWLNKVEKGWDYMKALIEKSIQNKYPKNTGWKFKNGGATNEQFYIEFLNKEKGFKKDTKHFKTYDDAVKWAKKNLEKFNPDAIKYKMKKGGAVGDVKKYIVVWKQGNDRWVIDGNTLLSKIEANKKLKELKKEFESTPTSVNIYEFMNFYNNIWQGGMFPNVSKPEKVIKLHSDYNKMKDGGALKQNPEKIIAKAHHNLTTKKGKRDYAPNVHEIQAEVDKMKFAKGSKVPDHSFQIGDEATYLERGSTTPTKVKIVSFKTAPNGKKAVVVQNVSNNKKAEIYSDRLMKVDGGKAISEFMEGQYVRLIGSPKLFVVTSIVESQGFLYKIETVLDGTKEKVYIPENLLLDAIARHNLPFTEGDSIENENNENMTIVKIEHPFMRFLDDNQQVVQYKGVDLWFIADVLRNLDSGKWYLHKTGVKKPKTLPYKIGDVIVDTLKVPNTRYVVHDIATDITYLRKENNQDVTDFNTDGIIKLLESGGWYVEKQQTIDVNFVVNTPTGQKTRLTYLQQGLVRTDAFKQYFGDWEKSAKQYIADGKQNFDNHYKGVSKVLDLVTLEPRLMYHGTMTEKEFYIFDANRNDKGRPYAYFAQNEQYAEQFKQSSQRNKGTQEVMYQCFLRVTKPFMAIGTNFETKKEGSAWWISVISLQISNDKYGTKPTREQVNDMVIVVESQIGDYITKVTENGDVPFWSFMARDTKSKFKAFLMSHNYDGVCYAENYTEPYDINNPAQYTMAVTLFDSDQIKLGDGRNLDFDKLNPDIRYEDGGTLHQAPQINESQVSKKHTLGKALFGDKYQYEDGGNLYIPPTKSISNDRAYVDDLIAKMKQ